jgi:tripartite-type tricarboxylate transporter receptor subunit TctC
MRIRSRLALACLLALAASAALAQSYPNRPIRLIVPWPPTGTVDILGRTLGQKLGENLAQSVIIDNRAGANGIIGSDAGAKSAPDGYTLVVDNITGHAINATLQAKMPFDSLRDFAHVSLLAWVPDGIVSLPSLPAKNVRELIALAKAQPGKLTYASFGVGSSGHLAGELFKIMAGVDMLHVPYKGGGPAIADLLAGQVSIYYPVLPSVVSLVKADRLRHLAVTGAQRSSAMPDVPTVAESGLPGFEASNWFGLMAPAGTPPEIVGRLNAETAKALQDAEVRKKLATLGFELKTSTPQEFTTLLRNETEKWAKVIKTSGVRAE